MNSLRSHTMHALHRVSQVWDLVQIALQLMLLVLLERGARARAHVKGDHRPFDTLITPDRIVIMT